MENTWIGYLQRSYAEVRKSLILRYKTLVPEMNDFSMNNLLIQIIDMFSGLMEQLHGYIDNFARESYFITAKRFSSMVKHSRLIDYRIKAASPATVAITFTVEDSGNDPWSTGQETVPAGTIVSTDSDVEFVTLVDLVVPDGESAGIVDAMQRKTKAAVDLGTGDSSAHQQYAIEEGYVDGSMEIEINSVAWTLQDTLGRSISTDKDFIVEIGLDNIAYARFGDGTWGEKPGAFQVDGTYYICEGILGKVSEDTIIILVSAETPVDAGADHYTVNNVLAASGGYGYEDVERIRITAPISLRTLNAAITERDFEEMALLVTGVGKAKMDFEMGKYLDLYIVPIGGGIATSTLLTAVETYFASRKMVGVTLSALPAGETPIVIHMNITGAFRSKEADIESDVEEALTEAYDYDNSDINKAVRASDLIALVDNLASVDYLKLNWFKATPYARPLGDAPALDWDCAVSSNSVTTLLWKLVYNGTTFTLSKNGIIDKTGIEGDGVPLNDTQNIITFNINSEGGLDNQDTWEFKTYAYNNDIDLDDDTIPVINILDLTFVIEEQVI